jgi:phosphatidylserine/phosphatidylglycerophosphate/cardiolipin synthase-like enzyme
MLIDGACATIGTANFDNRSFRLNFESTAVISDAHFATEVERMFEADFAESRVMDPGEYDRSRGVPVRRPPRTIDRAGSVAPSQRLLR